jgi:hypothetical protein
MEEKDEKLQKMNAQLCHLKATVCVYACMQVAICGKTYECLFTGKKL